MASSIPKCSIEVWIEGCGVELAYCRGMVCMRDKKLRILWLGRSEERHVHQRVKGCRTVAGPGAGITDIKDRPTQPHELRTVSEAVFGMVVAIAELLGTVHVELQALDNGSGKLLQLYERIAFSKQVENLPGVPPWMEAAAPAVAALAPAEWLELLLPSSFVLLGWAEGKLRLQAAKRSLPRTPWRWSWIATIPEGAKLEARLDEAGVGRYTVEVTMSSDGGMELLRGKGALRLRQRLLRVHWLGRSHGKQAHAVVKGHPVYESMSGDKVTGAVAILGAMASLAQSCGGLKLDFQVDDESLGKAVEHSRGLGFAPPDGAEGSSLLEAACPELVHKCLPEDWRAALPKADAFHGLHILLDGEA